MKEVLNERRSCAVQTFGTIVQVELEAKQQAGYCLLLPANELRLYRNRKGKEGS